MKKVIKKLASLLMVTVFVITGTTFQMLAGALSESVINGKQKLYISYYPYSYNFSGSGLGTSIYGQFVKINVGSANGEYAYCMDAEADSGITGTSIFTAEDFNLSDWVKRNYTSNQIKLMKYAAIYTIKNASETKYGYSNEVENIASQIINWTILHNWFNTSLESSVLNVYTANMPSSVASNVKACYNKIKEQILSHKTIPSFAVGKGQTPTPKKMTTNADGTFSITLTDNKNCSSYFDWAKALNNSKYKNYLSITTNSAGKLVIKSTKPIPKSDEFELTAKKTKSKYQNELDTASPVALIVDESQLSGQNAVGYTNTDNDPVTASISLYTDTIGTAQIKKVWQHNNDTSSTKADNSDIYFTIKNSSGAAVKGTGSAGSYTYSASGSVSQFRLNSSDTFFVKSLPAGTYTVYEFGNDGNGISYYTRKDLSQTVTVTAGGTGAVTFTNTRNTGMGEIIKTWKDTNGRTIAASNNTARNKQIYFRIKNADGKYITVSGTKYSGSYTFTGTSTTATSLYVDPDTGKFIVKNMPTGKYTVYEYGSPAGFTVNKASQTITISNGKTASVSFINSKDSGTAQIKKAWNHKNDTSSTKADYNDIYFTIKNSAGTTIKGTGSAGSYTYSASGSVTHFKLNSSNTFALKSLPIGTYTVYEYGNDGSAVPYYTRQNLSRKVTVTAGGTGAVTFTNTRNTGMGEIIKTWKDTNGRTIAASNNTARNKQIYFRIKNADGKYITVSGTKYSGSYTFTGTSTTATSLYVDPDTGKFIVKNMPTGKYTVYEYGSPAGFTVNKASQTITISNGKTASVSFINSKDSGTAQIKKAWNHKNDTSSTKADYNDIYFTIKNSAGTTIKGTGSAGSYTYSASGSVSQFRLNSSDTFFVKSLPAGTYTVYEFGNDGNGISYYTRKDLSQTVTVTAGGTGTVTFKNTRNTGTGKVIKTWIDTNGNAIEASNCIANNQQIYFRIKNADGKYITVSGTKYSGSYTFTGTSTTATSLYVNPGTGKFTVSDLPTGKYTVYEYGSPEGYSVNKTSQTITITNGKTASVSFVNSEDSGTAQIKKTWLSDTTLTTAQKAELEKNVYFTVKNSNGTYIKVTGSAGAYVYAGTQTTENNLKLSGSKFNVSKLPLGKYTITEINNAEGYSPKKQDRTITISKKGETKSVPFTNKSAPIVVIRKHFSDEDNLTDAELESLYAKVTVNLQVLGIGGSVSSNPPAGYYVNFTGSNGNYIFKDVTAVKTSAADLKLDNNGEITISFGTNTTPYYMSVIENYSGTDYETDNRDQRIDLGDGNPNTVIELDDIEINNQLKSGSVQIDKEFLNENGAIENITDEQLAEVTFKIAHNGKYLTFTGADGAYTYSGENNAGTALKLNKSTYNVIASELPAKEEYTVMEVSGTTGYSFSIDPVTFTITPAGTVKKVFTNRAMTGTISIVKHSTDGVLSGWQFRVTGTAKTGQSYDKTFTTDANGTITISNIRIGDYKVTEVKTDKTFGYITEDSKDIEVKTDTVKTVNFTNKPYANIVINKVDSVTNAALSGVTFGIFTDADCENPARAYTSATDDTLIDAVITESATGKYTCNFLPIESNDGTTYYVKEISAPEHYAIDTNIYPVTLSIANSTVAVSNSSTSQFINVPLGNVHVTKVDNDYPDNKLTGAEFTVYKSDKSTVYGNLIEVAIGEYQLDEIPAGVYYLKETKAPQYYNIDNTWYQFVIVNAGETVTVETNVGKGFENDAMTGSISISKHSADGKLDGWQFRVYGSALTGQKYDKTFTTDKDGKITVADLRIGDYTVEEVTAGIVGYITPDSQNVTVEHNNTATLEFTNIPIGNVHVTKVDKDYPDNKLTGAKFTVYAIDGMTEVGKLTEVTAGEYQLNDLPYGDYLLRETKSPENYVLDSNLYAFSIREAGKTVTVETNAGKGFENNAITGSISISKQSADGVLSGWQFRVTGTAITGQKYDKTFTTDAKGTIIISNLRIGDYKVIEVKTDKTVGYITEDSKDIEVQPDTITTVNFENKPYGNIVINKVDAKTGEKVTGATFGIYTDSACKTAAKAYTSDTDDALINAVIAETEDGKYTCNFLPISSEAGTVYYIKELTAPEGYYLDKNTYAVVLKTANATVSIDNEFGKSDFNEYPYGHATVIKDWKLDNSTADMTADEIAQMKAELEKSLYFTVKDSNGKFITATGADGVYTYNGESTTEFKYVLKNSTFTIAELPTGDYTITEYSTLPDYTIKSENPVKITVVRNQTVKATFVNERDTGTGKVIKVWKQFDKMTAAEKAEIEKNVYFTVTDSNGAYLKVKESKGSYIYCGTQKTETKFVLKNGTFAIVELPTGEYTVTEYNNAKDYSPKQQTQKIKITKNTTVALTFTNVRDTGNASIVKKWTNPNGLTTAQKATLEQNVYFTVKNADGTYLKAVSKNGKYVYNGSQTAEARFMLTNGKFELAELPTGKYTITEINNAVGYLPKTQVKTITVTKDATVSAEFVNKVIVGNVTLTKVDEDYPENKLTGAVFTVYKSDKKTVVGTMKETDTGVYSLEGLVYGEYYVQETKAPKYFVRDVNFYYFQIVNDGETVEVSNDELGKGTFINAPQKGEIKIVKTSYDKKVEGFHFEVTGKTYTGQDFKKTYTTDKNGIIRITDLRAGEYTIHEVKDTASAGYVLPGDVQLTIDRDGAVATAEMYNGNNPPSGVRNDELQTVLIIISAVALSAGAILISPRRKQHKH